MPPGTHLTTWNRYTGIMQAATTSSWTCRRTRMRQWTIKFRSEFKVHFFGLPLNSRDRFFSVHTRTHYLIYFWRPNRSMYTGDEESADRDAPRLGYLSSVQASPVTRSRPSRNRPIFLGRGALWPLGVFRIRTAERGLSRYLPTQRHQPYVVRAGQPRWNDYGARECMYCGTGVLRPS